MHDKAGGNLHNGVTRLVTPFSKDALGYQGLMTNVSSMGFMRVYICMTKHYKASPDYASSTDGCEKGS